MLVAYRLAGLSALEAYYAGADLQSRNRPRQESGSKRAALQDAAQRLAGGRFGARWPGTTPPDGRKRLHGRSERPDRRNWGRFPGSPRPRRQQTPLEAHEVRRKRCPLVRISPRSADDKVGSDTNRRDVEVDHQAVPRLASAMKARTRSFCWFNHTRRFRLVAEGDWIRKISLGCLIPRAALSESNGSGNRRCDKPATLGLC